MKIVTDTHSHTIASGHAYATLSEMVKAAADHGMELLGITEHAPKMPGSCGELYFYNFRVVERDLYGIQLMLGCELNILDAAGTVDLPASVMAKLDYCIASLHTVCVKPMSRQENTAAVINAMANPHIHIIGHPDDSRYPLDYQAIVQAAKEHHVLLEINNTSLSPLSVRPGAKENYLEILKWCKDYQVPVVTGTDAHFTSQVGRFDDTLRLFQETGFPEELVVSTSVDKLKKYLDKAGR